MSAVLGFLIVSDTAKNVDDVMPAPVTRVVPSLERSRKRHFGRTILNRIEGPMVTAISSAVLSCTVHGGRRRFDSTAATLFSDKMSNVSLSSKKPAGM